jgi:hypothetical protein
MHFLIKLLLLLLKSRISESDSFEFSNCLSTLRNFIWLTITQSPTLFASFSVGDLDNIMSETFKFSSDSAFQVSSSSSFCRCCCCTQQSTERICGTKGYFASLWQQHRGLIRQSRLIYHTKFLDENTPHDPATLLDEFPSTRNLTQTFHALFPLTGTTPQSSLVVSNKRKRKKLTRMKRMRKYFPFASGLFRTFVQRIFTALCLLLRFSKCM